MEYENNQEEVTLNKSDSLNQVTPLSKYLAMALFVILPFIGGWVGYTLAPEKIVEVEKEIIREVEVEKIVEVSANDSEQMIGDESSQLAEDTKIREGIFSPTEGAEFCLGDSVEISYAVPKSIKTVSISSTERPTAIAANIRTIQDTPGDYSINTFLWGQNEQSAYSPSASYAHRILIEGFEDGNPSESFSIASGVFAVIDCNI